MTPDHLLSLGEWDALPEDNSRRIELAEGVLSVSPRPTPRHQLVVMALAVALDTALSPTWRALPEVELLVDGTHPPTVRAPDISVLRAACVDARPRVHPDDVLAVVEVISPGSRRTDRVLKLAEYAEAGIRHYLLVESGPPVTMVEFELTDGAYERVAEHHRSAPLRLLPEGAAVDLNDL